MLLTVNICTRMKIYCLTTQAKSQQMDSLVGQVLYGFGCPLINTEDGVSP